MTKSPCLRPLAFLVMTVVAAVLVPPATLVAATPNPTATRPFRAPVTTQIVRIPTSIDATGGTDAGVALRSFIGSVRDGSIIAFPANAVYRLDRGLSLVDRHNLVFEGNGTMLRAAGSQSLIASSPFLLDGGNSEIAIRDFIIEGNNPKTGADLYGGGEEQQAIVIYGGTRIEIANNTIRRTWGDGVYASEKDTTGAWVDGLWVHDNTFSYIGRMGVTFNAVANGLVERNRLDQIGMFVFDIEPDLWNQGARNVTFRNNTVGVYGLTPLYTNWFFASANYNVAPGAVIDGVTISGNRVTGGAPSSANTPNAGGLATWIGRSRVKNVIFTGNTTTKAGSGPVLVFDHVDRLTVTANVQPLTSGSLSRTSDSTGVIGATSSDAGAVGLLAIIAVGLLGGGRLLAVRTGRHWPPPRAAARPVPGGRGRAL